MKAGLIIIGDEILIGQILDTNSGFIAKKFNEIGIEIGSIHTISDSEAAISNAIQTLLNEYQIVISTGGLGPTKDDVTKKTVCQITNSTLVENQEVLENVQQLLKGYYGDDRPLNELNKAQALVPSNSIALNNKVGTAPGIWTEIDDKVLINIPGVPFECKYLVEKEIVPRLQKMFKTPNVYHRTISVSGIGESDLAILVEDWENNLPQHIHLAYLPSRGRIQLRFSTSGYDLDRLMIAVNQQIESFKLLAGNFVDSTTDGRIEVILGDILKNKNLTLATAESCTGGNIAKKITQISGSSSYFMGAVVSYATQVKTNVLGVSKESVSKFTVVSEEVAEQMAFGALKTLNADIAIATTGVAGPNLGEDQKEVGTAFVAVCSKNHKVVRKFNYPYLDREDFIEILSQNALQMAFNFIKNYGN